MENLFLKGLNGVMAFTATGYDFGYFTANGYFLPFKSTEKNLQFINGLRIKFVTFYA